MVRLKNKIMEGGLRKESFISIGLALALFGAVFVFGISQEKRVTQIETLIQMQHPELQELKRQVKENRELLLEIKQMNKRLDRIERKLDID